MPQLAGRLRRVGPRYSRKWARQRGPVGGAPKPLARDAGADPGGERGQKGGEQHDRDADDGADLEPLPDPGQHGRTRTHARDGDRHRGAGL